MGFDILADGFVFLEGPRWHDGRLVVSDMHGDRVVAVGENGETEEVLRMSQPSGLGWLPDGRLLVVSMVDRKLMRRERDGLRVHADLSGLATFHCNDMVVDVRGRAYVGNFGWDFEHAAAVQPAVLARVDPDGHVERAAEDLLFPNGMVITPDGKTLIVAETFAHRLTAFAIDADGRLSGRRVWAAIDPVFPDGICLDADRGVWVASPMTREVVRIVEGGAVTERIPTGDRHAIACMLGGADRRTLFVMTAPAIPRAEAQARRGGRIEVVRVAAPGAGCP